MVYSLKMNSCSVHCVIVHSENRESGEKPEQTCYRNEVAAVDLPLKQAFWEGGAAGYSEPGDLPNNGMQAPQGFGDGAAQLCCVFTRALALCQGLLFWLCGVTLFLYDAMDKIIINKGRSVCLFKKTK